MNAIEKLTTRKSVVKTARAFRASNPVSFPIENQWLELDIVSGMNAKVERKVGSEGKRETAPTKKPTYSGSWDNTTPALTNSRVYGQ
jgi:hypothetical protein